MVSLVGVCESFSSSAGNFVPWTLWELGEWVSLVMVVTTAASLTMVTESSKGGDSVSKGGGVVAGVEDIKVFFILGETSELSTFIVDLFGQVIMDVGDGDRGGGVKAVSISGDGLDGDTMTSSCGIEGIVEANSL